MSLETCLTSSAGELSTNLIAQAIDVTVAWQPRVEPYPIHGASLRELGD